jgi:hypothetical protein
VVSPRDRRRLAPEAATVDLEVGHVFRSAHVQRKAARGFLIVSDLVGEQPFFEAPGRPVFDAISALARLLVAARRTP